MTEERRTLMSRVWNSPWLMLLCLAYCVWIATIAKHGFWYWVWIVNANYAFFCFIQRANKRWRRG